MRLVFSDILSGQDGHFPVSVEFWDVDFQTVHALAILFGLESRTDTVSFCVTFCTVAPQFLLTQWFMIFWVWPAASQHQNLFIFVKLRTFGVVPFSFPTKRTDEEPAEAHYIAVPKSFFLFPRVEGDRYVHWIAIPFFQVWRQLLYLPISLSSVFCSRFISLKKLWLQRPSLCSVGLVLLVSSVCQKRGLGCSGEEDVLFTFTCNHHCLFLPLKALMRGTRAVTASGRDC